MANDPVVIVIHHCPPDPVRMVVEPPPAIRMVTMGTQGPPGPPGPQGPPGTVGLGGYAVDIDSPLTGDLLGFTGTSWSNRHQESLTDGGNF